VTAAICQWLHNHCANCQHSPSVFFKNCYKPVVQFLRLWQFAQGLCGATIGISQPSQKPRSSKIHQIWRTGFYIDKCATIRTVALRQTIFKQKKGFATISLGLICHSLVLSQLPSRGTVPIILSYVFVIPIASIQRSWYEISPLLKSSGIYNERPC
jgi:hypothetical protein